ncbi:hypothetical protein AUC61_08320 [Pseudomonas sp. S25]|uniref:Uncharacterized protein n=1 Tax=Pseudomonas maioricensis TaxID=1766623 RepID=A0ABS9ZI58_9PSED|nr:hypothetical protein [Pseudomonas sp. S25]
MHRFLKGGHQSNGLNVVYNNKATPATIKLYDTLNKSWASTNAQIADIKLKAWGYNTLTFWLAKRNVFTAQHEQIKEV